MLNLLAAPAFGPKHLVAILYVVILVVVGVILLSKKDHGKKIFLYASIAFIVLEVLKLGFLIIRDGSYPMNHLPFHLCSIPLYIYPIIYFAKENSKLEIYSKAAAFATVIGAALAALLIPENIIGSNESWFPFTDNYLPLISFTYHGLMLMFPILMLVTKQFLPTFRDIYRALVPSLGLMILAMIFNALLDKDYMLLNTGNGSPLKFILDESGQFAYTSAMILLGMFLISFIMLVAVLIRKLVGILTK